MTMKAYAAALVLSIGVIGLSSTAMAQTVRQACGQDIQQYCPGAGPKNLKQCLKQHVSQLSPVCIGTLVKMKEKMGQ